MTDKNQKSRIVASRPGGKTIKKTAPIQPAADKAAPVIKIEVSTTTGRKRYMVQGLSAYESARQQVRLLQDIMLRTMPVPDGSEEPRAVLRRAFDAAIPKMESPPSDPEQLWIRTEREFLGFGRLDSIMTDPMVEEITCDGPNVPVFIYHREHGAMETNLVFTDEAELDGFVIRMAQMCNREITYARPMLEATLPDSSRLQASLSREITTRGSSFTIRRFLSDPLTPLDLINRGTMSPRLAAFLWMVIESKASVLFVGGTASGKTTSLNACCAFIPQDEKIVSIEDTRELNLPQDNWTPGVTRPATSGASGDDAPQEIDMYKLLATALRQRPDYILVGEVRGAEAVTLFQAMATGHATMSTMHADSPLTAIRRLENPPIGVPRNLIEALGLVIMHRRAPEAGASARRIYDVSEVSGVDPTTGDLLMRVVFKWDPATDKHEYMGKTGLLARLLGAEVTHDEAEARWDQRTKLLETLAKQGRITISQLQFKLAASQFEQSRPAKPVSKTTRRGQAVE